VFVLTAIFYFSLAWPTSLISRAIERRLAQGSLKQAASSSTGLVPEAAPAQ
jgi:hypothetical protein